MEPLKPLFRWPGGKRWLTSTISSLLPTSFGRYFEPFFGAGALYFSLLPDRGTISDANHDLMDCYRVIRDDPDAILSQIKEWPQDEATYFAVRTLEPGSAAGRAARHIYLAKLAFNGIYRVNRSGQFNVPFSGRRFDVSSLEQTLPAYARALTRASISTCDFGTAIRGVQPNDVVYFDPPYTVLHTSNGFLKYNRRLFLWQDQLRLAKSAERLRLLGATVVVSAPCHESVKELYPQFEPIIVHRSSVISAASSGRGAVEEYLFVANGQRRPGLA